MASRGSVIPLFVSQIKAGLPITVTDPNMTRFMMSLESAVDLVLFAFENGENGDIFVKKSPATTIDTLARAIRELYKSESEIKLIGSRHGEKLYETLVNREEMVKAIDMDNFYRIPADNRDLNYNKYFTEGTEAVSQIEEYHSHNTRRLNLDETKELLLSLRFIRNDVLDENPERVYEP
jgi:UDP-glucose 4-epimerase